MESLLRIQLKELRRDSGSAVQYLRSKISGTMTQKGSQLIVEDAKAHDVKLLLNKFLHHKALKEFRVVAVETGVLEVRRLRSREDRAEPEGNPPPPSATVPYYFPQPSGSTMLYPTRKRSKKRA